MKQALVAVGASVIFAVAIMLPIFAQSPLGHRVMPVSAELAASGITGTTGGSANTVMTLASDCGMLSIENTCTVELDAMIGSAKKRIPANSFRVYDMASDGTKWASGTVIGVFYPGSAPSSCAFEVLCNPY